MELMELKDFKPGVKFKVINAPCWCSLSNHDRKEAGIDKEVNYPLRNLEDTFEVVKVVEKERILSTCIVAKNSTGKLFGFSNPDDEALNCHYKVVETDSDDVLFPVWDKPLKQKELNTPSNKMYLL